MSVLDVVHGQARTVEFLAASSRQPVHAYLFVGPAGVGKRAAAQAFAGLLLCKNEGCGECRDCRLAVAGTHPDVRIVERVGAAISVEQADEIITVASRSPVEGDRKVLILDDFHLIRPEAAAKLLKTIEEPPLSTIFIVVANDVPPEFVTIASRCVRVGFQALSQVVIADALTQDGTDVLLAQSVAAVSGGSLERARLLVNDPGLFARREVFAKLPYRLDGSGAAVAVAVKELLSLIDDAAVPLAERHEKEIAELEERSKAFGERGSGKKQLEERHKRELRRHRTDELRAGLVAFATTYRNVLVESSSPVPGANTQVTPTMCVDAVRRVHELLEAMERNPNDLLQLQALLLQMPSL
jgi:DNA polymerase III subunit delta'